MWEMVRHVRLVENKWEVGVGKWWEVEVGD
jgi:hypothetical protein